MDTPILHDRLPEAPWLDPAMRRLPGIRPRPVEDWILRDEAFAGQMALRDTLIAKERPRVHELLTEGEAAARELLEMVLNVLATDADYRMGTNVVTRPDGQIIDLDTTLPLVTLGRLVQSDFCILEAGPDGHVMSGAILCFPAGWTLAQKIGRPLDGIHGPVKSYDADVGRRVQRLFDAIRPDQILWRANAHLYDDPTLFAPRTEAMPRPYVGLEAAQYVRSERQTLRRLPRTGAVVFGIHSLMVPLAGLTDEQRAELHRLDTRASVRPEEASTG